jgi:hypothetical protein
MVDVARAARVDCAAVEQVARLSTLEEQLQMLNTTLIRPHRMAPFGGAVSGRGVPTSR